eukprot:357815-Chlamydomonas_euryale.AAC.2
MASRRWPCQSSIKNLPRQPILICLQYVPSTAVQPGFAPLSPLYSVSSPWRVCQLHAENEAETTRISGLQSAHLNLLLCGGGGAWSVWSSVYAHGLQQNDGMTQRMCYTSIPPFCSLLLVIAMGYSMYPETEIMRPVHGHFVNPSSYSSIHHPQRKLPKSLQTISGRQLSSRELEGVQCHG